MELEYSCVEKQGHDRAQYLTNVIIQQYIQYHVILALGEELRSFRSVFQFFVTLQFTVYNY